MKGILVLLVLLIAQFTKVCPQPHQLHSNPDCQGPEKYLVEGSTRCCSKCQPGQRLVQECSESNDSVCAQCQPDQYMETLNYHKNCFSCPKCKSSKGLQYAQECSATKKSWCKCKPGWYCTIGYIPDKMYCSSCQKYRLCRVGFGVSTQGTESSNTKCVPCPNGTFSDIESYTDPCRPHTDCGGGAVVKKGNATSDTVCDAAHASSTQLQTSTKEPLAEIALTTASTMTRTLLVTPARGLTESTQSVRPSVSDPIFNNSTKSPILAPGPNLQTIATICGVTAVLFLLFTIFLLILCKSICKKDADRFFPKVDANGNCESGEKIIQDYMGENQLISFAVTSPEQQCLLEKAEASSEYSQCSNNTETLTRTDGCSSHESIGPLQSTIAPNNLSSALSEPLPLISNTDSVVSQPSLLTQSSSQPTSPQIISPVTTSPHVNVNITFHIGNGSCGTPPVMSTDSIQAEHKLPFGEEEESFSIPQQEDGKRSLMSVEESTNYCS